MVFRPQKGAGKSNAPPEANQMKETNETTACRITITLDSAELPVDEQARNALLTEFRSRAGHLVEGLRGIDADQGDVDEIAPIPLGDRIVVPIPSTEDDVPDRLVGVARADGETLFTLRLGVDA
uniref:Uncharacterized protein n=2 Tax=Halorubrum lacusprofundi TaxID=2247 RepID=A0A220SXX7_9EURY|nr:hypothetical protein [Halorubrum lacusprofundi]